MSQNLAEKLFTVAEYLAYERRAEFKHEYYYGHIIAMAGASRKHNLIIANIVREIGNQLRDRPCETYPNDMRVRTTPQHYIYPDVVIVCDDPRFEDNEFDTLLNPVVIIEVLSKSTEARDRGDKFADCREIESLREYILISQDKMSVEKFTRQDNNVWVFHSFRHAEDTLTLDSINCQLSLAEIYQRITFPPTITLVENTEAVTEPD